MVVLSVRIGDLVQSEPASSLLSSARLPARTTHSKILLTNEDVTISSSLPKKSALQIKMLDKEFSSSLLPPFHPQPDGLAGPLLLTIRGDFTINLCLEICLCILHCKECSPDQVKILDKELWFLFFKPLRFCQIPFATRLMVFQVLVSYSSKHAKD